LPGKIRRLTVAAIVDVRPAGGETADPSSSQAMPPLLQQEQIEKIVKSAVGFDAERNDEVQVVLAPLQPMDVDEPVVPGFVWQQWQPLIQSVSLGLAATLTFLIGLMLMKRMKPIVFRETVGPGIPLADARRLATISEQAKAHPEIVASILSAWLNEQQQTTGSTPPTAQGGETLNATAAQGGGVSVVKSAMSQRGVSNEGRRAA
jgi:flagellar M-ring protein FliF